MKTTSIKLGIAAMLLCVGTACNVSAETEIRTIDIKALNGEDVKVIVSNGDELHRIELEIEDIENNPVLLEKLRNLEPEIQETVLEALRSLNDDGIFTHLPSEFSEGLGKVIVVKTANITRNCDVRPRDQRWLRCILVYRFLNLLVEPDTFPLESLHLL